MKIREIPYFEDHFRFLKFIDVKDECWNWSGNINKGGYGTFHVIDQDYPAHRVSFSIFKHSPSTEMVLDHVCRNRSCVNPDHLKEVTENENTLRNSLSGAAINKAKTHCIRGHELVGANTIPSLMKSGSMSRNCRTCFNNARRIRRANGSKH